MGARIVKLFGSNAVDEIVTYARNRGFTRIVVGHRTQPVGLRWLRGALSYDLIQQGAGLEITTVTEEAEIGVEPSTRFLRISFGKPSGYVYASFATAIATLCGLPFRESTDIDNLAMFYLVAVVGIAALSGTVPAIFCAMLSVAAFSLFFVGNPFLDSFAEREHYFTFFIMFITSIIVGSLAAKLSQQARQARRREGETSALYTLTKELSAVRGINNMALVALKNIREAFNMDAAIFIQSGDGLQVMPADSPVRELKEESVARWVLLNGQIAGRNTDTLPSAKGIYIPLSAEGETLGVLELIPDDAAFQFQNTLISQLESFASLIGSAFQRASQATEAEAAQIESEGEKLRNVLLSSVSHDLRTPLASITGAASAALMMRDQMSKQVAELVAAIHSQAARLAKLVTNLLDATSLESGIVKLNKQPYFITEVIGSALTRVRDTKGKRTITSRIAPDLPLIEIDGLLIEQLMVNLLDNAIRYTENDGKIRIKAEQDADVLRIQVADNGTGLPEGDDEKIFEKFYTHGHRTDGNAGLGLAICRGIITAHGGMIYASNNKDGGATITFTLPGLPLKNDSAMDVMENL